MTQMKNIRLILASAAVLIAAGGMKASAQQVTDDLGTWTTFQMIKSWDKPVLLVHLEHRSNSMVSNTECFFGALAGSYRFTDWISMDAGYEFWRFPSANMNLHKGVAAVTGTLKCDKLTFALRERYELAFNEKGGMPTSTFRSRIRTQYTPDSFCMRPYIMYEIFNGFGATYGWIRSLHYLGADIVINRHNMFDIYYMYHMFPDKISKLTDSCHIIGVTYRVVL